MAVHLQEELVKTEQRVTVGTRFGAVRGGRAENGAAVFLEIPYALPPVRFADPQPLPLQHRYEDKDSILESSYAIQPTNDGQAAGVAFEDKVGLGKPTENPLFVNIVSPPSFPHKTGFPVKIYIHGGFLQFGSPHGVSSQAQYLSAERSEVWVNIGYRLSAFGFLACDEPKLSGNYGFKDQWLALLWVKENIAAFGGDPDNIQLTGLSAGGHSVHQILHHVSLLPPGQNSPFHSAIIQSNAIILPPKKPEQLRPQFQALCRAAGVDPTSSDALSKLRDPNFISAEKLAHLIETEAPGPEYSTFRGCLEESWLPGTPDVMDWQRSGGFAKALKEKGVRSIVVGDLTEEWFLYSIAHDVKNMGDIDHTLKRYFQDDFIKKSRPLYQSLPDGASESDAARLLGEILSDGQVHLPVRLLARDLMNAGFPVLRYEIRWTPEQVRPLGLVTHGTDRPIWALRLSVLDSQQANVARAWLDAIAHEVQVLEEVGKSTRLVKEVLALREDKTIGWQKDAKWERYTQLSLALPGEVAAL